jgi:ABC-type nickel/cobalt efflux system permease component RcnA
MSSISLGKTQARSARSARAKRVRSHDGPEPWIRRDLIVVAVVLAVAVIGIVLGWLGVSDTVDLNDQTRWLGFGIGALILGGFAMVFWLLLGLRSVAVLRREVMVEVNRRHPEPVRTPAILTDSHGLATVPGMRRFHLGTCQMLEGKTATFATAAEHAQAGLLPCPICLPEGTSHE